MINSEILFNELEKNSITFFSGVPDSLLKYFCSYVSDNTEDKNHIIASNEGAAISIGIGYHLATGGTPLIYMQNSGLGNSINPLVSLADSKVYSIPMVLMIGWRGEPGITDEPQHLKQGMITTDILETLDIPFEFLSSSDKHGHLEEKLNKLCQKAKKGSKPVALVVKKGTFSKYELKGKTPFDQPLFREEALEIVASEISKKSIIVATTGMLSRELFEIREKQNDKHERDFLTVGGMGHTSQIALGIALQNNRQVFCLDGDGSMIMHMGSFAINARSEATNFKHILFNNSAHDSVGGQPTVAGKMDLEKIIKGFGYKWFKSISIKDDIRNAIKDIKDINGPAFLEIRIKAGSRKDLGRPTISPVNNKIGFMEFIRNAK